MSHTKEQSLADRAKAIGLYESRLIDWVIHVEKLTAQRDELLTICEELQESAEYWSEYFVPIGIVDRLDAAIAGVKGNHIVESNNMVETTAPAIVFFPAGSLGEEVTP